MKEVPMMARVAAAIMTAAIMTELMAMTDDEIKGLKIELANDYPVSKFTMVIKTFVTEFERSK